jgi:Zn-dependent peptidase ImmA (M78 family)
MRVPVKPELIRWACNRMGCGADALIKRFPKLDAWQRGEGQPTFKQLEAFAQATHTPIGFLFLPEPPIETIPIPDFRTVGNALIERPTPDLLDTIYLCQQRQEWYREYTRALGEPSLAFIGSAKRSDDIGSTADHIRAALGFSIEERRQIATWSDALRHFIEQADRLGVLVMVNGVVGSNNRRRLDPAEFRGFALSDQFAPLVFINGADTKAAQMFTLAHELAHLWLGESALSDVGPTTAPSNEIEHWCNRVAAELLVTLAMLRRDYRQHALLHEEIPRLARQFKVSTLVILRRIHDAGGLTREQLWAEYEAELARLRAVSRPGGGDFYLTTAARVGQRFARAVISATWEGRSSFTEGCRLLGFKNMRTFRELGMTLGVRD